MIGRVVGDLIEMEVGDLIEMEVGDLIEMEVGDLIEMEVGDLIGRVVGDLIEMEVGDLIGRVVGDLIEMEVGDLIGRIVGDLGGSRDVDSSVDGGVDRCTPVGLSVGDKVDDELFEEEIKGGGDLEERELEILKVIEEEDFELVCF